MGKRRRLVTALSAILGISIGLAAHAAEPDPRLAEKVTIDCANTRLYKALDRISAETGVTIRTGKSKNDWRVRDVPVLVCARDIPLVSLLRGVADATHLLLSRSRTDDGFTYRIWRDLKREKELAAFQESRQAAALAAVGYDWDVLSLVKDLPESEFEERHAAANVNPDDGWRWASETRSISRIVAELGPQAKDRALAGEAVLVCMANAPETVRPHLRTAFETFWQASEAYASRHGQPLPEPFDDQKLSRCYVEICARGPLVEPGELSVEMWTPMGMRRIEEWDYEPSVRRNRPDVPPKPTVGKPNLELDELGKPYVKLALSGTEGPAFLDTKVKIAALKEADKPNYADLLCGLSKAAGYSIVAEGSAARYHGSVFTKQQELPKLFGREIAVREALAFSTGLDNMEWYLDDENKLILGRDVKWTERLKALVPEKLLLDLRDKVNGKGIELDDLQPLVGLTESQFGEWIRHCPEFPELQSMSAAISLTTDHMGLWGLYFALSPSERTAAKSGHRVSLAGLDPSLVCQVVRRHLTTQLMGILLRGKPLPREVSLTQMMDGAAFVDPDALPPLWMRIETRQLPRPIEDKHDYLMCLEGQDKGEPVATENLFVYFPVRAPEPKPKPEKEPVKQ